jgi:hypothetical protein
MKAFVKILIIIKIMLITKILKILNLIVKQIQILIVKLNKIHMEHSIMEFLLVKNIAYLEKI